MPLSGESVQVWPGKGRFDRIGLRGILLQLLCVFLVQEGGPKVNSHHSSVLRERSEHVVLHIARNIGKCKTRGMGCNHWFVRHRQHIVEGLIRSTRESDEALNFTGVWLLGFWG